MQRVHVEEGQAVLKGAPLLDLEPYDLRERLAQARATLAAQQANLDKLKAGSRKEDVAQARAARDRAQFALNKLIAGPRPLEIKIQEAKLALAQAELTKAQQDFDRVKKAGRRGPGLGGRAARRNPRTRRGASEFRRSA